jgi:hypothetical protein
MGLRRGHGQRSDLLVILMLAAMVCVMGSRLVYLVDVAKTGNRSRRRKRQV